jgi:fucose 4-O-acetylase-like acetyltransferase
MKKKLIGIDMFRGLAIFAVVVLHVDGSIVVPPLGWAQVTSFAKFTVPFFLAASFYLAIDKLYSSLKPYPLRSRLTRLLIPYSCWSALYVFYKIVKYSMTGDSGKLVALFHDPLALICFGGAAFHLYFLPLLAIGTILIKFSEWTIAKKISLAGLVLLCLVSFITYEILIVSGNSHDIVIHQAFQPLIAAVVPMENINPLLRWIAVSLACVIRCLPYILVSTILNHPAFKNFQLNFVNRRPNWWPWLWLFIFIILNGFGSQFLPQSLYEVSRGYLALWTAISLSNILKDNYLIQSLGACSFGIYLSHIFVLEFFQSMMKRIDPDYINSTSTPFLLMMAIVIMGISWAITLLLTRTKRLSSILF